MIGLKNILIKLISATNRLPNWFDPDGGDTSTRPESANITLDNNADVKHFLATSSMTTGKPAADGNILSFAWDNGNRWHTQLAILHNSGLQYRHNDGNANWGNWQNVYGDYTSATKLTLTYTSNSYVNQTCFNRIQAWKIGKVVVVEGNLQLSAALPTGTSGGIVYIGKISNAGTFVCPSTQTVICGSGTTAVSVLAVVETDGRIGIYNYNSTAAPANGWIRFMTTLICT